MKYVCFWFIFFLQIFKSYCTIVNTPHSSYTIRNHRFVMNLFYVVYHHLFLFDSGGHRFKHESSTHAQIFKKKSYINNKSINKQNKPKNERYTNKISTSTFFTTYVQCTQHTYILLSDVRFLLFLRRVCILTAVRSVRTKKRQFKIVHLGKSACVACVSVDVERAHYTTHMYTQSIENKCETGIVRYEG